MTSTKLSDLTTGELREILAATERSAGIDSASAKIIRREIERRGMSASRPAPSATTIQGATR